MNKVFVLTTAAASFLALTACETAEKKTAKSLAESGAPPLTAEEIRSTLIGNSVYSKFRTRKSNSPAEYTGYYEDGTIRARAWGSGWDDTDSGTWEATSDSQYCRSWNNWREGKRACYELYKLDDGRVFFKHVSGNGSSSTETVSAGNTFEL